jgi:hypothetical protein
MRKIVSPPSDESTIELLQAPQNRELMRKARAGARLELPRTTVLKRTWSPEVTQQLTSWLKAGGGIEELAALLRANPPLIMHPVVLRQIGYLDKTCWVRLEDVGEAEAAAVLRELGEAPHHFTQFLAKNVVLVERRDLGYQPERYNSPAARHLELALKTLVCAWAEGLFPGYDVQITPRPQTGRPGDMLNKVRIFKVAKNKQEQLQQLDVTRYRWSGEESRDAYVDRIARMVAELREEPILVACWGGQVGHQLPYAPEDLLPVQEVREDVAASLAARGRRLNLTQLARRLVARRENISLGALRNIIYEVERDYPALLKPHTPRQ